MIKEIRCGGCGAYHVVIVRNGKFYYDGNWVRRIKICDKCPTDLASINESEFIG